MNSTLEFFIGTVAFLSMTFVGMLNYYFFSKKFTCEWYPVAGIIFAGSTIPFGLIRVLRMMDLEDWQFTPYLLIASSIFSAVWAYFRGKRHAKELDRYWDDPFYRNRKKW